MEQARDEEREKIVGALLFHSGCFYVLHYKCLPVCIRDPSSSCCASIPCTWHCTEEGEGTHSYPFTWLLSVCPNPRPQPIRSNLKKWALVVLLLRRIA